MTHDKHTHVPWQVHDRGDGPFCTLCGERVDTQSDAYTQQVDAAMKALGYDKITNPATRRSVVEIVLRAVTPLIEADLRARLADEVRDVAFEVFTDTDGDRSIRVHTHHEGLTIAERVIKGEPL